MHAYVAEGGPRAVWVAGEEDGDFLVVDDLAFVLLEVEDCEEEGEGVGESGSRVSVASLGVQIVIWGCCSHG